MRTDHNVIGETHSLLTPLSRSDSEASSLRCSRRRRPRRGRRPRRRGWVACVRIRCGLDAPRPATAAARATFSRFKTRTERRGVPRLGDGVSFCEYMIFILIRSVCSRSGSRALRLGCSAFRAPVVPFPSRVQPTPRARAAAAVGCFCKLRPAASDVASRGPEIRVVVRRRRRGISPQTPIRPEIT